MVPTNGFPVSDREPKICILAQWYSGLRKSGGHHTQTIKRTELTNNRLCLMLEERALVFDAIKQSLAHVLLHQVDTAIHEVHLQ